MGQFRPGRQHLNTFQYETGTGDIDLTSIDESTVVLLNGSTLLDSDITLPQATTSNGGLVIEVVMGPGVSSTPGTTGIRIGFADSGSTVIQGIIRLLTDGENSGGSSDSMVVSSGDSKKVLYLDSNDPTAAGGAAGSRYTFYYTGVAGTAYLIAEGIANTSGAANLDTGAFSGTGTS